MASLREIRRKIKSIKSTQQITKAMKMVSAARLRRAQARIVNARPFAQRMERLMQGVAGALSQDDVHPLMKARGAAPRILLVVTSDRGLCGAFNTNLIREALRHIRRIGSENVRLFVIGRKGRDFFRRMGLPIEKEYTNIFNQLTFAHAELVASDLVHAFLTSDVGGIDVIYNEFKSVIHQKVVIKAFLPVLADTETENQPEIADYLFEPAKNVLLEGLVLRFVKAQMFRILLESNASELGARMASMDNATRNARELIGSLTLQLNRTRQASITKEILEVVSGAEALK